MAVWAGALIDLESRTRAFFEPHDLKVGRRLNAAGDASFWIQLEQTIARELTALNRAVVLYRDEVPRFKGRVVPPLSFAPQKATVTALDPFYDLGWRRTQLEELYGATPLDQVAAGLLATQNARGSTHLRMGAAAAGAPPVDRVYAEGQIVSALMVSTLCEIDQGLWLRVDPVEDPAAPEVFGELVTLWPDAGGASAASFEFGEGTRGNVSDYRVEWGQVRNRIRATGASFGAAAETAIRDDALSQTEYGIFDDEAAFTDEDDTVSLDEHALAELDPTPPTTISITPTSSDEEAAGSIDVPALWDDFDVGDTVAVLIRDSGFTLAATGRVTEAIVAVADTSGRETLQSLTLEAVEVLA